MYNYMNSMEGGDLNPLLVLTGLYYISTYQRSFNVENWFGPAEPCEPGIMAGPA